MSLTSRPRFRFGDRVRVKMPYWRPFGEGQVYTVEFEANGYTRASNEKATLVYQTERFELAEAPR